MHIYTPDSQLPRKKQPKNLKTLMPIYNSIGSIFVASILLQM